MATEPLKTVFDTVVYLQAALNTVVYLQAALNPRGQHSRLWSLRMRAGSGSSRAKRHLKKWRKSSRGRGSGPSTPT